MFVQTKDPSILKLPHFHKHFELIGKAYQSITEGKIEVLATVKTEASILKNHLLGY